MNELAKRIDLHYVAVQGTFGVGFSALMSFGAVLMLSRGLSNSALGIVTCIAQLLPMVLQGTVAALGERSERMTTRRMILLLTVPLLAIAALMMCAPRSLWVVICGYIGIFVLINLIIPYHNILMVEYLLRGVEVNYGLGRGVGSGSFALTTLVLGFVLEGRDASLIVPVIAGSVVLQMLCTYAFRYPLPQGQKEAEEAEEETETGRIAILRSRPDFVLMLLAVALLLGVHNVTNVYMVHVIRRVGGAEGLMGTIMGISAFMELLSMPLFPKLQRKLGLGTVMRLSALFFVIRLVMLLTARSEAMLFVAAVAQFFQSGLLLPSIVYYVAAVLPKAQQTGGQSMMHLTGNCLGAALITLIVGPMVDWRGINAALWLMIALAAAGTVLVVLATRKKKEGTRYE